MGSRATVIPGKSVGSRTVVAAGAVVMTDVPADVIVAGNPARVL
jgi:maltose O-acetyltransferase